MLKNKLSRHKSRLPPLKERPQKNIDSLDNPFLEEVEEIKKVGPEKIVKCTVYIEGPLVIILTQLTQGDNLEFIKFKTWFTKEKTSCFTMNHSSGYTCISRKAIKYFTIEEENV